ncbi:MAG: ScpA family protein [Rhodovibrionaceae bacterium]|nr:ScpA family protein [Rhodovibrionaceae bacterium]
MSGDPHFEEDTAPPRPEGDGRLVVDLEGFEGPIDVLLQLARDQKVDVTRISILELAEQYLAFVREARRLRLELAADYLVMAAWLAYLKSRLLLPEPEDDGEEPSGAEMAAALRFQLQRLEAMQEAARGLFRRPALGSERLPRGAPEALDVVTTPRYQATLYDLLRAYARQRSRGQPEGLRIGAMELYSVDDALARLRRLLGSGPDWRTLSSFLPHDLKDETVHRSAVASHLAATLEMVRDGDLEVRQDGIFGPILVRRKSEGT